MSQIDADKLIAPAADNPVPCILDSPTLSHGSPCSTIAKHTGQDRKAAGFATALSALCQWFGSLLALPFARGAV